jgi:bifunctional UDP-N-acetylglucosamine pyrophosphorylase/glucosamine-1-phosphate N-acetyltransferase
VVVIRGAGVARIASCRYRPGPAGVALTASGRSDQSSARLAVVVLAAGQGTRLRSRRPKPLHAVGGRPLIDHVLRAAAGLGPDQTIVVTGHGAAEVRRHLGLEGDREPPDGLGRLDEAHQAEQLGTAHAVAVALPRLQPAVESVVILYADTPLLTSETLAALVAARAAAGAPLALVTCRTPDPTGYGRIVRDGAGRPTGIVEEKAATPEQRAIDEINTGFYAVDAAWLRANLPRIERNPAGEYYLTDLIALAVAGARPAGPWPVVTTSAEISEAMGINDRVQLAEAGALLRRRTLRRLMLGGATIVDPATTYIDDTVEIGPDTIVLPGTTITGATRIGGGCTVGPQAIIDSSTIGDRCRVVASVLESCIMEADSDVGPFSHLRPGAHLESHVHVGNYAEVKNARLGSGTAMGHFSYIGDATVGRDVNIAAGVITANYDGRVKHHTTIGDAAFIGCDTVLRAPVEVGQGAVTGAGAIVTRDIPPETVAVGMPARPIKRRPRGD